MRGEGVMRRIAGGLLMAGVLWGPAKGQSSSSRAPEAAAAPATTEDRTKTVQVDGDHLEQSVRCTGNAIEITGSNSRLSVLGNCTQVRVLGSRNNISVEHAGRIVTAGHQNNVVYLDPRTKVTDSGKGNSVTEKWQQ